MLDHHVIIKVHRILAGRRHITASPVHDLPRTAPEEILTLNRSKGVFDGAWTLRWPP